MTNSKCYKCKHNYKSDNYSEPKCNCMCANYSDFEPITNFDRIKRMTVEELAVLFAKAFAKLERTDQMLCSYRGIDVNKNIEWLEREVD